MTRLPFNISDSAFIIATVFAFSIGWFTLRQKPNAKPLPPGPKPLPIIGNAHQLPAMDDHAGFRKLRKIYGITRIISLALLGIEVHVGDVVHFAVAGQHILMLNSPRTVFELLEKHGGIFSSRPASQIIKMLVKYHSNY